MKLKNYRLICFGLIGIWSSLVFWAWSGAHAFAQEMNKKSQGNRKSQTHIISDRMEVNSRKNLIIFIGNVEASQGSISLKANRLEVYTLKINRTGSNHSVTSKDKAGDITRIVATGNVEIDQAKRKFATAARIEYQESTGIAILTGNPRVWEGKNRLVGAKIELNLRENKTIVHGSPRRRVSVTLSPSSETPRRKKSN